MVCCGEIYQGIVLVRCCLEVSRVWYDMIRYRVVWVWHAMLWYGMLWYGVVRYCMGLLFSGCVLRCDT